MDTSTHNREGYRMITAIEKQRILSDLDDLKERVISIPTDKDFDDKDYESSVDVERGETKTMPYLKRAKIISVHKGGVLEAPSLKHCNYLLVSGEFIGTRIKKIGELNVSGRISIVKLQILETLIATNKVYLPGVKRIEELRVYGPGQCAKGDVFLPDIDIIGTLLMRGGGKIHVRETGVEIRKYHEFNDSGKIIIEEKV